MKDKQDNENDLIWGKISNIDILKNMYRGKKLIDMSDEETNQMLEDLISAAMNQAMDKASKEMEGRMKQATGGINIPGLF